jgi:hypothetical protein
MRPRLILFVARHIDLQDALEAGKMAEQPLGLRSGA